MVAGALVTSAFAAEEKETSKPKEKPAAGEQAAKPKSRVQQMTEELKLSDDQRAKLRPILQEEGKKLREIRQDTALEKDQKTGKLKEIRATYTGKIKEVLTADQWATWEKGRADRDPQARGKGPKVKESKKEPGAKKKGKKLENE